MRSGVSRGSRDKKKSKKYGNQEITLSKKVGALDREHGW